MLGRLQEIPVVNPVIKPVRTRQVFCPVCKKAGHYRKSCPDKLQPDGDHNGDNMIAPPTTRANQLKRQKTAVRVNTRTVRARETNESGESGDELDDDINPADMAPHTNVHGIPVGSPDLFAGAVAWDTEAEVVDTDSVFNENPDWARSEIHREDRETRGSSQQLNVPVFRGNKPGPKNSS